jgi:hypothetical protein
MTNEIETFTADTVSTLWEDSEAIVNYAILQYKESCRLGTCHPHWESLKANGKELTVKVEQANSKMNYSVTWLIDGVKVSRREFVYELKGARLGMITFYRRMAAKYGY